MIKSINLPNRYKIAASIVVGLAFLALFVRLIVVPELSMGIQIRAFFASMVVLGLFISLFFYFNHVLNKVFPYEKSLVGRITIQLVIGLSILFGIHFIMLNLAEKNIPFKVDKIFFTAVFLLDLFGCLAINMAFFAEYIFRQWKVSIQKAERLEREKTIVQYDNLKNQLNPHFLFNSLASLNSLISHNQEQASQFLQQLSKVYRYLLENKEVVSIGQELDFVKNYVSLLKTRFGEALEVSIDIKENEMNFQVVPASLQNLLENALKHNVIASDRILKIRIYRENEYLCVDNSLQRKSIVENSNRQGLLNLKNLYRYLSSKEVLINETKEKFSVKVPVL